MSCAVARCQAACSSVARHTSFRAPRLPAHAPVAAADGELLLSELPRATAPFADGAMRASRSHPDPRGDATRCSPTPSLSLGSVLWASGGCSGFMLLQRYTAASAACRCINVCTKVVDTADSWACTNCEMRCTQDVVRTPFYLHEAAGTTAQQKTMCQQSRPTWTRQ